MISKTYRGICFISFLLAFGAAFFFFGSQAPQQRETLAPAADVAQTQTVSIDPFPVGEMTRVQWLRHLRRQGRTALPGLYTLCLQQQNRERLDMVAHYWSAIDPAGFLDFLTDETSPFFKDEAHAHYLFSQWGARDFEQALQAAHAVSPYNPLRPRLLRAVVRAQLPRQPEKAIAALADIHANAGGSGSLLRDRSSPEQYLALLSQLPRGALVNSTIDQAVESWAERDPDAAFDWLHNDVDALDSNHRFSSLLSDLARKDANAALERIRQVPSATRRGAMARNIADSVADAIPDEAVQWIEHELGGWYRTSAAAEAANELAEKDPVQGANFAIRFQNPKLLERAVYEALVVFHNRDPQGLQQWTRALPEGAARDAAMAEMESLKMKKP